MNTHGDPLSVHAQDEALLAGLRGEFPDLHITSSFYGPARVWEARGPGGRPWLVASDDADRFRAALRKMVTR